MSTANKGVNVSKNPPTSGIRGFIADVGDRIKDIFSSTKPDDANTGDNVAENQDIKESPIGGHTPTLYSYDRDIKPEKFGEDAIQKKGAPSIFNPFAVFTHPGVNTFNDFYDIKGVDGLFPKFDSRNFSIRDLRARRESGTGLGGRNLTIESLLSDFSSDGGGFSKGGSSPYYASDFLYARYYKRIPLNRIITLRRFPFPTYDNLDFISKQSVENRFKPISQAVTYFGEPTGNDLKELTKWAGVINWDELTADVHDVEGNEQAVGGGNVGKLASLLGGKTDLSLKRKAELEHAAKFNNFEYTNKVIGPVNVVNQTYVRQRGLGAKKKFDIVFEYELKSYNNINPRLAMLDLLCNMLALTFNNAKFWGGANRYFPKSPQFGFAGDQKAFYEGRYGDYLDDLLPQISAGAGDAFSKLGDLISSLLKLDFSSLADIGKKVAFGIADLKSAKTRPQMLGFHALLTGLPVGEWHMTIGNPYRPIIQIGNLICKGFEFEMSDHLGVDDFPSILKFTTNLETGRPRDKGDLESIFQFGEGRMYYPPEGLMDIANTSVATVSTGNTIDANIKQQNNPSSPLAFNRAKVDPEFAKKLIGTVYSLLLPTSSLLQFLF